MNFRCWISENIFLDTDGTYYLHADNSDCNDMSAWTPLMIGPLQYCEPGIPF